MKILVLNTRVNTIDFELYEMPQEKQLCKGIVERVGMDTAMITYCTPQLKDEHIAVLSVLDHQQAVDTILKIITTSPYGVLKNTNEIDAIGHRVVHGGEKYFESVLITHEVKQGIHGNIELAPLHNPFNLKGIEEIEKELPGKPQVAVFDTAFHQTLPESAYRYPISDRIYQQTKVRKYGFHGISHRYVTERTSLLLKKPVKKLNIISIHLGQGSSLCAIKNGVSVDTSMGLTPIDGLMMMTRSGSISPSIILHLSKSGMSLNDIDSMLNRESGVFGISGVSDAMIDNIREMNAGNKKAKLAINMFVYRVKSYIGSYSVLFDKLDAICFTGGIGENADIIRKMVCEGLKNLGIGIDLSKNKKANGRETAVNKPNSKVKILVIPRDETILIARDTYKLVKK
ncbi:MAG: hypothetical protein A2252_07105 [Elusimicrobia bacterium RIFOXYA2_FULL_39_19]|nr:MAG: hypothetical protein A2252_07105 [Elusimicrobia bacterium RIFOXYA2_FULL_39_19]